jgi:hypothetical protein
MSLLPYSLASGKATLDWSNLEVVQTLTLNGEAVILSP